MQDKRVCNLNSYLILMVIDSHVACTHENNVTQAGCFEIHRFHVYIVQDNTIKVLAELVSLFMLTLNFSHV